MTAVRQANSLKLLLLDRDLKGVKASRVAGAREAPRSRCPEHGAAPEAAGLQEGTRWQSTTPSNQNRILLKRRPHQNLIDNEIWTP